VERCRWIEGLCTCLRIGRLMIGFRALCSTARASRCSRTHDVTHDVDARNNYAPLVDCSEQENDVAPRSKKHSETGNSGTKEAALSWYMIVILARRKSPMYHHIQLKSNTCIFLLPLLPLASTAALCLLIKFHLRSVSLQRNNRYNFHTGPSLPSVTSRIVTSCGCGCGRGDWLKHAY
jgi:hypothetical protein